MTTVGYQIEVDTRSGIVNLKKLDREFDKVGKGAKQSHKQVDVFTKALPKMGLAITAAFSTAAVAAFVVKSASAFGEFESALIDMAKVTDESLSSIDAKIKTMDAALGSYTELTRGYYQVMSAGITEPTKAMDTLVTASKLAKVAHVNQSETVKGLTSVLEAYGDTLKDATEAGDLLLQMEAKGKTSVQELIPVIGKVAGLSSALNVSSDEMAGLFSKITLLSGGTAFAATQYEALMSSMMRPTEDMAKLFEEFGGAAEAIKKIGIEDVLKRINEEAGGSAEKLGALFGQKEAIQGFITLFKDDFKGATENIQAMNEKTGALDQAWKNFQQTWEGVKDKFDSTMKDVLIEFGKELSPSLMKGMDDFSTWAKENKQDIIEIAKAMGELTGYMMTAGLWAGRSVGGFVKLFALIKKSLRDLKDDIDYGFSQTGIDQNIKGINPGIMTTTLDEALAAGKEDSWQGGKPIEIKVKTNPADEESKKVIEDLIAPEGNTTTAVVKLHFTAAGSNDAIVMEAMYGARRGAISEADIAAAYHVPSKMQDENQAYWNQVNKTVGTDPSFGEAFLPSDKIQEENERFWEKVNDGIQEAVIGASQMEVALAQAFAVAIDQEATMSQKGQAMGSLAGGMIGSMYGPAGQIAGAAIGGAAGKALGGMFEDTDVYTETERLADEFRALQKSMKAFDDDLKRRSMSMEQQADTFIEGYEEIIQLRNTRSALENSTRRQDILDEIKDLNMRKSRMTGRDYHQDRAKLQRQVSALSQELQQDYTDPMADLQSEINQLFETLEPYRQAILNAGLAAKQNSASIMEDRSNFYRDREREEWGISDWKQNFEGDADKASAAYQAIATLKGQLVTLTEGTAEYRLVQADLAFAQIQYNELLEQAWESEQAYISALEKAIDSQQALIDSLNDLSTSLLEGDLNPDQSFAWAQAHYNELLAKAQSSGASNRDIEAYESYVEVYLRKARDQYGSTAQYADIFNQVLNADITDVQDALTAAIEANTAALEANTGTLMAFGAIGTGDSADPTERPPGYYVPPDGTTFPQGFDGGGISYGPLTGHVEMLHGTEAIIPVGDDNFIKAPVQIAGDLNQKQTQVLLQDLVSAVRQDLISTIKEGQFIQVDVDGGQLNSRIRREADRNRVDADRNGYHGRKMVS